VTTSREKVVGKLQFYLKFSISEHPKNPKDLIYGCIQCYLSKKFLQIVQCLCTFHWIYSRFKSVKLTYVMAGCKNLIQRELRPKFLIILLAPFLSLLRK